MAKFHGQNPNEAEHFLGGKQNENYMSPGSRRYNQSPHKSTLSSSGSQVMLHSPLKLDSASLKKGEEALKSAFDKYRYSTEYRDTVADPHALKLKDQFQRQYKPYDP